MEGQMHTHLCVKFARKCEGMMFAEGSLFSHSSNFSKIASIVTQTAPEINSLLVGWLHNY